ncbi:MAG: hypothetical protein R3E31_16010 [Chloroflexota bacterium]
MIILRDDKRIARFRRVSQYASLIGLLALLAGLVIALVNPEQFFLYELLALMVGWLLSQIGVYYGHRYMYAAPRPDEVLDKAVRRIAKDGRIYHYLLPVPHVLLTPQGIIIFVSKFQGGKISVHNDKWRQTNVGMRKWFWRRIVRQPNQESRSDGRGHCQLLRKNAPEVEKSRLLRLSFLPQPAHKNSKSAIPASLWCITINCVVLRQQHSKKGQPTLSKADYEAIKAAF